MPPTSSGQSEYSEYMVQSYRQAVPQQGGRERRKELPYSAQFDHADTGSMFLYKDSNTTHF